MRVFISVSLILALSCFLLAENNIALTDRVVADNAGFAADIYRVLCKGENNIFISPYSISCALAMTYAGARGNTALQMAQVMNFILGQELHPAFREINSSLGRFTEDDSIKLYLANSIWPSDDFEFLDSFTNLLEKNYNVAIYPVDYDEPESARSMINKWISHKTIDKINDMIPPGALNPFTVLVLTNAVYFNAGWQNEFNPARTSEADFYLYGGETVSVMMMNIKGSYNYAGTDIYQILELPYTDREMSMVIILPAENEGLKELEKTICGEMLHSIYRKMRPSEITVYFPKFKFTYKLLLNDVLKAMGMIDAFSDRSADFTGMYDKKASGGQIIFINNVRHKAFIEVDEKGTEAAAATTVEMGKQITSASPYEPEIFRADHPFLYFIRDNKTGSILFIGRVLNPLSEEYEEL